MSALSKFHSTRLSIQELLSGRIRLQRYGLFLKLKHLYSNKTQINFISATRLQRNIGDLTGKIVLVRRGRAAYEELYRKNKHLRNMLRGVSAEGLNLEVNS